jgi:predicted phage-related endonuclease
MQINMRRLVGVGMSQEVREARQGCIGGSDARIIMSGDQKAIETLWREKRGEKVPKDLSEVILVQLGNVTENLNLAVFEGQTGSFVAGEQTRPAYEEWPIAMSTLDGLKFNSQDEFLAGVSPLAIVEAKFALPFRWTLQTSIDKHYAQVQHNMMVTGLKRGWLSIITGGGQYAKVEIEADYFYQMALLDAEQEFWKCVETGRRPGAPEIDVPVLEVVDEPIDMSTNNAFVDLAITLQETCKFAAQHEKAKKDIKELMPKGAKIAFARGVTISRAVNGRMTVKVDGEAA